MSFTLPFQESHPDSAIAPCDTKGALFKYDGSLLVQRTRQQTILAKESASEVESGHIGSAVTELSLTAAMPPANILIKYGHIFQWISSVRQSQPQRYERKG